MRLVLLFLSLFTLTFAEICDEILLNPTSFFSDNSNFTLIKKDTNCIEMAQNLESLEKLTYEIRGNNIDCDGSKALIFQQKFKFEILKALLAPEIYKKTLPNAKIADDMTNNNRDYFKIWSTKSLYNRLKFDEFNSFYQVAVPMLVDYYQRSYDKASAIYYANRVANEFLNAAVGSFKEKESLSELENLILNPKFDKNELISYLYTHPQNNLSKALKVAILENRDIEFLAVLMQFGANLNSGHESAIFYALKNLATLKFLLENGANVNYQNSFGKTSLFYAAEFMDENLVNLLVQNGANTNALIISSYEKSALDSAGSGYLPFSLCGLNHTSKSLLMHAAKYSNLAIVKTLIKNGAVIDLVDDMGFSAIDYAKFNSDKSVYRYFKSLGLQERNLGGVSYE
ncbi:ankyrin repeat domain-containing protein [Campylobacter corcagiensis]|uniref:Ankyrin repeat domain-containing protein n=1 Tax=Campylobacter corcagiensis TaxID=1448857 RepID=A0A7M1LEP8_9BACT|nr:ankyrin repeat domain-containing protein [Campylobacter corcagiensis]QKF64810.1 ankyrin domain-containing protein [Campylobacter corcagiensis]QOQ87028.1 ankyrin repeat domain-containing protein [Campylobacter corcagiensis]